MTFSSSSSSSSSLHKVGWALFILVGTMLEDVSGFYLPGVHPRSFAEGDVVNLKVNKMTSTKTLLPFDYYRLPFCQPRGGPRMDNENLGEFLAGDRIESSPYILRMKEETYCKPLCVTNVGRGELKGASPNKSVRAIRENYHNNWIVDNLPSASKIEDDSTITTKYWQGFPVGYIRQEDQKAYINNHVNIEVMIHPVETEPNKFRIVRFTVEPFSIKHEFEDRYHEQSEQSADGEFKVEFIDPIPSCDPNRTTRVHTDYDMIKNMDRRDGQVASGQVLFTYDVTWTVNTDLKWASRWDIYLSMDNAIPDKIHLLSIVNSLIIVVVLIAIIAAILVRDFVQYDYSHYDYLALDEEKAKDVKEFGLKLVHADVFRPPAFSPLLLAVSCGTGAQILCMSFLTIIFSALGFLSPANRGSLLMAELYFYVMMGVVAGYVTSRLYKTFDGKSWQCATMCTALGFPGIAFALFFLLDMMALINGSTYAVPFTTILVLLVLWLGISTPLVFFGAYLGYKQDAIEFPVKTSSTPRPIPDQPWFMGIPFALALGGILPFGACFVELFFILESVWKGQCYYAFGFLLLVYFLLIVTCAEVTVLMCYIQLTRENYHWWWRSFCTGGSIALYVFLYSVVFFNSVEAASSATYVFYFGYMSLVCLGLFLMTGFVGVFSSLLFNKAIFSTIKIDE